MTPSWVKTVGVMIREGVRVRSTCRECRTCRDVLPVDLQAIAAVKGEEFSLIGIEPRCRIVGCKGRCFFLYSPGPSTPFRPLH